MLALIFSLCTLCSFVDKFKPQNERMLVSSKSEQIARQKRQFDAERKERQQRFQGVNLYIKNLEEEIDDAQLREEFNKFGTIISAKVC